MFQLPIEHIECFWVLTAATSEAVRVLTPALTFIYCFIHNTQLCCL